MATFHRLENRSLVTGELGCHVCGSRYPVLDGVVYFGTAPSVAPQLDASDGAATAVAAIELAAFLDLSEHGRIVALTGSYCSFAHELADNFSARVFAANPRGTVSGSESVGVFHTTRLFPVAPDSLDGIALDDGTSAHDLADAIRCLRPEGRAVFSPDLAPPAGVVILARDKRMTVARKLPPLTTLNRASR